MVLITGALWGALRLDLAGRWIAVLILFALPGGLLIWSAVSQLRELARKRKEEGLTNRVSR